MLSGCASKSADRSRPRLKSPNGAVSLRLCVHTRNNVEPGRYSHRNTAFPRSERKLKSGLVMTNELAGPGPSGSIAKVLLSPDPATVTVPTSFPYVRVAMPRGLTYSLKFE